MQISVEIPARGCKKALETLLGGGTSLQALRQFPVAALSVVVLLRDDACSLAAQSV